MEDIACIFCAKKSNYVAIEEDGYQGKKCSDCSLIYISPRPMIDEVLDIYGHGNAHITAQSHIAGSFLKRLYARHHLAILKKYIKKGKILEIGSGAGYFLDEARRLGFEPFGLELNPDQAEFMQKTLHIPCEQKPLAINSFSGTTFDVICHSDVISHFHDPIKEFGTMHALLGENGYLMFETGNIGDVDAAYYPLFSSFQYPDHLFFFSEQTISLLLEKTGFKLVGFYRYSIVPQLSFMRWLKSLKNTPEMVDSTKYFDQNAVSAQNAFIALLKKCLKNSYYYFLYFLRYGLGKYAPKKNRPQTIMVIARKL